MNNNNEYTNRLASEKSLYLLMHAHNPVDWFPWGDEAFTKARHENKLLVVSIGYASCHWCHVMEHESFSHPGVAQIMNQHFVCVKVDREERPDIDGIYMNAVMVLSGHGGWPLNAIILPDGKPVFAATYLPRENWMNLLLQINQLYKTNGNQLVLQAAEITSRVQQMNYHFINPSGHKIISPGAPETAYHNLINTVDFIHGGLGSAPKFPMPVVFEYLLHHFYFSKEKKALDAVTITLNNMLMGGIYDQIGGGFARYSTDNTWKVPHFEKMLYDNAQLVSLYANAFKLTQHQPYTEVIKGALEFISREMTSGENGFYSAIDADSEGVEGKFYVWGYDEFKSVLDDSELFMLDYFSIEKDGNWEDSMNILFRAQTNQAFMLKNNMSPESFNLIVQKVKHKLLTHRNNRVRPLTDTKVITSWNALMIKACIDAYSALGTPQYLSMAVDNAQFIVQKLSDQNSLYRNYNHGEPYTAAKLDDYANVISAFISLYQTTFDEQWLEHANKLTQHTLQHFYDPQSGMFFYTSDSDETLITRQIEISDQVIPSSNSVMALNLFYLGTIYGENYYLELSAKMLANVQKNIIESPGYFANWAKLQMLFVNAPFEVAIVGEECAEVNRRLNNYYLPNAIFTGSRHESNLPLLRHKFTEKQTNIFICKNKVCSLPITNVPEAIKQLGGMRAV